MSRRRSPNGSRVAITCQHCGNVKLVRPCFSRTKYCSKQCSGAVLVRHMNQTRRPATQNSGWFKATAVSLVCEWCNGVFNRIPSRIKADKAKGRKHILCSPEGAIAFRRTERGTRAPYWIGGVNTGRGRGWRERRLVIVSEQNGHCARCGTHVGRSLVIHHIVEFEKFATAE